MAGAATGSPVTRSGKVRGRHLPSTGCMICGNRAFSHVQEQRLMCHFTDLAASSQLSILAISQLPDPEGQHSQVSAR